MTRPFDSTIVCPVPRQKRSGGVLGEPYACGDEPIVKTLFGDREFWLCREHADRVAKLLGIVVPEEAEIVYGIRHVLVCDRARCGHPEVDHPDRMGCVHLGCACRLWTILDYARHGD